MSEPNQVIQVQAYLTSDGKLHKSNEAAQTHQAELKLTSLISRDGYNSMSPEAIANMLMDNAEEFAQVLQQYLQHKAVQTEPSAS